MRFWDSSALVALLAAEASTVALQRLYASESALVWWGSLVECASAVTRLEREGGFGAGEANRAFARLDAARVGWIEIEPGDEVREVARRMLRVHPLRAGDGLQLAAAFLGAERRPATLPFVTLDLRLRAAAAREGFPIVEP